MSSQNHLPQMSRIAYYTSSGDELIHVLCTALRQHVKQQSPDSLTKSHLALTTWGRLLVDVPNGGFTQFFYNNHGDAGVMELSELLASLGHEKAAALLGAAVRIYRNSQGSFQVANPWEGLFGSITDFKTLEREFVSPDVSNVTPLLAEWARSHLNELVLGDDGNPIDPLFTGTVETHHPNGQVAEVLEVRNGNANGIYKEFFDDGMVRKFQIYKEDGPPDECWPNGQLRKQRTTNGPREVIEWHYPSGSIHKRVVRENNAYLEPIRLFHENGQLAEELHMQGRKKQGPWLKLFQDGSPRLQAEHSEPNEPIIYNAWDDDRRQIVHDGAGNYDDDGGGIDTYFEIFSFGLWRRISELENGVRHGKSTAYKKDVLWSVTNYVRGKVEGESTTYWNNGRKRTVARHENGKEIKSESFPKLDRLMPAVTLDLQANEELYTAWLHHPVDRYPAAENLDEIRAQLKVPQFLREVHQRNVAGQTKSRHENCNTFDDSIAYFVTVDTSGKVVDAKATGSGTYSGREWGTYVALLKQLQFTPGSFRGRAIECRTLAGVHHTFVEGLASNS